MNLKVGITNFIFLLLLFIGREFINQHQIHIPIRGPNSAPETVDLRWLETKVDTHYYEYSVYGGEYPRDGGVVCYTQATKSVQEFYQCLKDLAAKKQQRIDQIKKELKEKFSFDLLSFVTAVKFEEDHWNTRGERFIQNYRCEHKSALHCDQLKQKLYLWISYQELWIRLEIMISFIETEYSVEPIVSQELIELEKKENYLFGQCQVGVEVQKKQALQLTPEIIRQRVQGTWADAFYSDLVVILSDFNATDYDNILAMAAVAQVDQGVREVVGRKLSQIPLACSRYKQGYKNIKGSIQSMSQSYEKLRSIAKESFPKLKELRALDEVPAKICNRNNRDNITSCYENAKYPEAQKKMQLIILELASIFEKYPLLSGSLDAQQYYWKISGPIDWLMENKIPPEEVMDNLKYAYENLSFQLLESICGGGEFPLYWYHLISYSKLQTAVLDLFPELTFVDSCLHWEYKNWVLNQIRAKGFTTALCLSTMINPVLFMATNPVCCASFLALAKYSLEKNEDDVRWVENNWDIKKNILTEDEKKHLLFKRDNAAKEWNSNLIWAPIDLGVWKFRSLTRLVPLVSPSNALRLVDAVKISGARAARSHDFMDSYDAYRWMTLPEDEAESLLKDTEKKTNQELIEK